MLDTNTKRRIDTARDILVGQGVRSEIPGRADHDREGIQVLH